MVDRAGERKAVRLAGLVQVADVVEGSIGQQIAEVDDHVHAELGGLLGVQEFGLNRLKVISAQG